MADAARERALRERRALAVAAAVKEAGLEPSYALAVAEMIDEDDADWPACCGSSCDPCVLSLAHAARGARARLQAGDDSPGGADGPGGDDGPPGETTRP